MVVALTRWLSLTFRIRRPDRNPQHRCAPTRRPDLQICLSLRTVSCMHYIRTGAILTTLAVSALPCFAQAGGAELFGMITDPSSAAVPETKVELMSKETGARF